jgi:uncharacterized protein YceK
MRTVNCRLVMLTVALIGLNVTGCATYRTVSAAEPGTPKLFSGTRLDLKAVAGDESGFGKYRATPPTYPWIDLPLSAFLDTLILPLTFPVATYEFLFE